MRIKSIELGWFRGAAEPVSLESDCKSMVVYGENGSGKSSFVDAVEYVVNNNRIDHLKNEYSGRNQVKAILNTHKPDTCTTALRFKFKDVSDLKIDFGSNGSSKTSGTSKVPMGEWEYRQTVLRQDEVSRFIHGRKGEKYSALLPLFGLHEMEVAAENLRQLARSVETEAKLGEKKSNLVQIDKQRKDTFESKGIEEIVKEIDDLCAQYGEDGSITSDTLSRCNELEDTIDRRIGSYSANSQMHIFLREVAGSRLKDRVDAVRASSVDLAVAVDGQVAHKLAVLRSAGKFVSRLSVAETLKCPACGQEIAVNSFRDHVKTETARLQEASDRFDAYRAATGTLTDTLISLKANLNRPELRIWRDGPTAAAAVDSFKFLEVSNIDSLRETCNDDNLTSIDNELLPIITVAETDSKDAPPEVQKLTDDKKRASVAKIVIGAKALEKEITEGEALVALLKSLEQEVRSQIRQQSQKVINNISQDIESMWAALHPGEGIESVALSLPPDADKAIDVVLKFHGKDQESPRLTLSEGYRNSLGLCIFLAMAKQVVDTDRPLLLDDVVVSLDRNHRGMIQELLEKEFSDRQVFIFTHDREWYTELRNQLGNGNRWIFKTLLPYESPEIGIRWSQKTTTFEDARAQINNRPDVSGNDARKIMDVELPEIAERLQIRLPYLRSEKNDRRMAHDFLTRLVSDGKKCFQKRSGGQYVIHECAIDACYEADQLLKTWGNKASHSFDIVRPEAIKLLDACENAISQFKCVSCKRYVWRLTDNQSKWVQCQCGEIRWRYGKA